MGAADILFYHKGSPLLFNSGLFFVLFLAFYCAYLALGSARTARLGWVVAFSLFFYYKSSGAFVGVLCCELLVDYAVALRMRGERNPLRKRAWLYASLGMNLGILGYFKYANFLLSSAAALAGRPFDPLAIALPAGVSFFTFQGLSYTLDVYRGEIQPSNSLLDYSFFATFFPQLVAGPIVRARQFLPQMKGNPKLTDEQLSRAWMLILGGLFKKAVLSDYISLNFVDRVFDAPHLFTSMENLLAVYGYALQIYCDFSGYSDMAIGLALLLGFQLPTNFNAPYRSQSLSEFWGRWHISLSSWLRDYLYIPLGGNRKGRLRTYVNLMLTMLLGGLWHGASWKFMAWGGLHGVGLAVERALGVRGEQGAPSRRGRVLRRLLVFHLVCFGWIWFRAADAATALQLIGRIADGPEWTHLGEILSAFPKVFALMALGYALHFLPEGANLGAQRALNRGGIALQAFSLALLIWCVAQVQGAQVQPFIYFQF
jgi:D-alanyl-lipoteichoic acid acyltransferase DltB (MBOAT superfamily)